MGKEGKKCMFVCFCETDHSKGRFVDHAINFVLLIVRGLCLTDHNIVR